MSLCPIDMIEMVIVVIMGVLLQLEIATELRVWSNAPVILTY